MNKLLKKFSLYREKEDFEKVSENITNGIYFRGTNLWILIFAIFIASLGLNVNSPAVIIGAMLVSPLMGPIMGMGFSMAINDLPLLKKSFSSYLFATGVSLATSTLFFLISPINDAHSEILARTSPNIYDVLIAVFGGLAGMLATSSKMKGNVLPGVAIATALMPPLCTAGYGLATLSPVYFFGAFYLFVINTVFIALSTLVTVRLLKYPSKELPKKDEKRAHNIIYLIVCITILPSIYFGYDVIRQNRFTKKANKFIDNEAVFTNDYLLRRNIEAKSQHILLVFGGAPIEEKQIQILRSKLYNYSLQNATLEVKQGFAYVQENMTNEKENPLQNVLAQKEKEIIILKNHVDSMVSQQELSSQVFKELRTQYASFTSLVLQQGTVNTDSASQHVWIAIIESKKTTQPDEKKKIEQWLKVRLKIDQLKIYFENK